MVEKRFQPNPVSSMNIAINKLNSLDRAVVLILVSEHWHELLNKEANTPLKYIDTFFEKRYEVRPGLEEDCVFYTHPWKNNGNSIKHQLYSPEEQIFTLWGYGGLRELAN